MLDAFLVAWSLAGAPPAVPVPRVVLPAGFPCTTAQRDGEMSRVATVRCTRAGDADGTLLLDAVRIVSAAGGAPSVDVLCRPGAAGRYGMVFETVEQATPAAVQVGGLAACRVEVTGTSGTRGGPWRLVDVTVPVDGNSWMVLTVQGRPAELARHKDVVEAFLTGTRPR